MNKTNQTSKASSRKRLSNHKLRLNLSHRMSSASDISSNNRTLCLRPMARLRLRKSSRFLLSQ